jgi:xylan 1,4-beta-xylosidase
MLKSIVRFCLLSALSSSLAQTAVNVNVNLNRKVGTYTPIFSWFGYDESNYSTTERGQALLHELHDLSPVPVYIRAHFLLASGDGKPELKWSSSNVYTEDANGNPVYNWTILNRSLTLMQRLTCVPWWSLASCRKRSPAIPTLTT